MKMALIHKGASFTKINARHAAFRQSPRAADVEFRYQLLPMREVYFHPAIDVWQDMLQRGNLPQLHLLALVAVLILIVGIFNFMSLYTVVLLKRSKEFRLKKVFWKQFSTAILPTIYREFMSDTCIIIYSLVPCRDFRLSLK